jgi:alpha-tubulin suppressor-like RCC1 family protein
MRNRYTTRTHPEASRRPRVSVAALVIGLVLLVIAAASSQAVAAPDGQLYAFGVNGSGQLGSATHVGTGEPNPSRTAVSLPGASGSVTQAAVGEGYSLAVTSTGQLYSFGENQYGQLGLATNSGTFTANPTPALVAPPGATGPVSEVAAGANHSLVATSTGQLYSFGENQYGQLGNATNNGKLTPNPTPTLVTLPGATGPVTQIAAGAYQSLVVTSTGQLYAFGRNLYGELGSATHNGTAEPNPTPTLVGLPGATGPVTEVAAGESYGLVVTSTGQLYAFGENFFGQLGNATDNEVEPRKPHPTPTLVSLPGATGPATQVAAGAFHALALTGTGQLYGFGSNFGGQLGNATNNGPSGAKANPTPTLVSLPGATGPVSQITAAYEFSLALTSSGQLYGFGLNRYGQLGSAINNGTIAANFTPALVSFAAGTTVDAVGHGPYAEHTLVIAGASSPVTNTPLVTTTPTTNTLATAPTLTAASLTNRRFRVAKKDTAISAKKAPLGTTFRFTLSAPAKLQIAITRSVPGLRRGHSCLAPNAKLRRKHAKRCTRTLTVGTLTRSSEPKGADSIAFSGRIGHRALSPQPYKALLSASNARGRSKPVTLAFVVVR